MLRSVRVGFQLSRTRNESAMDKVIVAIVVAVIGGLIVWFLTSEGGPFNPEATPTPRPTSTPTFSALASGSYSLASWTEAVGPIRLGVGVKDGSLNIDGNGNADWDLGIWDSGRSPQTPPGATVSRLKCGGQLSFSSRQLSWVIGGDRNVAIDWERGITSVRDMVWPTFCGGHVTGADAPFAVNVEARSNGQVILEMSNSQGTFIWTR